jgi:hypothetical protein
MLPFKGGVHNALKTKAKYGVSLYVAMWQGLRGEDLCIDTGTEITLTCSQFAVPVIFTIDIEKFSGD